MQIIGLVLSLSLASPTTLNISSGSIEGTSFVLPIGIRKSLSAWGPGNNGGVDIPGSIGTNAWGHVFVIYNPTLATTDVLLSASAYNPVLPSGYTQKQIIQSFLTNAAGEVEPGEWTGDGRFTLSYGREAVLNYRLALPPPNPHVTYLGLVSAGTPYGVKLLAHFNTVGFNSDGLNYGFYSLLLDPDAYPIGRLDGSVPPWSGTVDPTAYARVSATALFAKPAGFNFTIPASQRTDEMGQVFFGSQSGTNNNFGHLYLQGWTHPREPDRPTVSIAIIGASLTMDRNANNWPNVAARELEFGKSSRVKIMLAGKEGQASSSWLSSGWASKVAAVRPHVVVLDMTADANPGFSISTSQSLANIYTFVDTIRANNPNVPIFLFKANHMRPDATQFANVLNYYANYAVVQANRSDIFILDTYTPWGNPALHPEEYANGDGIHPLFSGNTRATIPAFVSAIAPMVN